MIIKIKLIALLLFFYGLNATAQVINAQKTTQRAARATDTAKVAPKNIKVRMVGGGQMSSADDVVENIGKSKDHSIFLNSIATSGLAETLKTRGPLTVFAPTNQAFKKLAPGVLDTLLKPKHNADLTRLLTYHVVTEKLTAKNIARQIAAGKGEATFNTLAGSTLKARLNGDRNIVLIDENGNEAVVSMFDIEQNNGIIDVVDTLLIPKT